MLKELNREESMSGSEVHFLTHPSKVAATLEGGIRSPIGDHTLPERVGEDDPSVLEPSSSSSSELSSESSSSSSSMSSGSEDEKPSGMEDEEDLPPLIRIKDEKGEEMQGEISSESLDLEPIKSSSSEGEEEEDPSPLSYPQRERGHPKCRSVEQGFEKRHQGRHQAFCIRRKEANRRTYRESVKPSLLAPQVVWGEKGSEQWLESQKIGWEEEVRRMFSHSCGGPYTAGCKVGRRSKRDVNGNLST
jgi:hypothetical protein